MSGVSSLKSCLGKVFFVGLLVAAAYGGWRWGPAVFPRVSAFLGTEEEAPKGDVSPEVAEATMDRFEAMRRGEEGDRLALSASEIESVLRYAVPGLLPAGIMEPRIRLADGVVTLGARVAVDAFPDMPDLDTVLGFLPDTMDVSFEGVMAPLEDERWDALVVEGIQVGIVPLPGRLIPEIIQALGREYVGGLPDDALAIPLPDGLQSVYIAGDSLVLVSDRPGS